MARRGGFWAVLAVVALSAVLVALFVQYGSGADVRAYGYPAPYGPFF